MKIAYKQTDNGTIKEIIQQGNHFFVRVTEQNGEVTESQDYNTLERAKESIGIKPTITENNKLLAEFMGLIVITKEEYLKHPQHETLNVKEYSIIEYQRYNKDWNWLIQVVEKIESIGGVQIFINGISCEIIFRGKVISEHFNSKIEAVYNACVKFVKWYTENSGQEK